RDQSRADWIDNSCENDRHFVGRLLQCHNYREGRCQYSVRDAERNRKNVAELVALTGSPSSPFSVRVTSSLRQLTTLRMSEKPISLSSRTTCSTVTSACSVISAMRA